MNIKLIKALSIVCLVLIVFITLEWLYAKRIQEQQLQSTVAAPANQTLSDMPTIDLNSEPETTYADLVERPLFISGRKPVPENEQTQPQTTINTTGTFDWQLNGIYTTKKGLMALLTRTVIKTPGNKYRKVIVNDNIDEWKVDKIHKDRIQVTQGGSQKELMLRKTKPKTQKQSSAIPVGTPPVEAQPEPPIPAPEPITDPSENDNNAIDQ
jgi:hypothetical protein